MEKDFIINYFTVKTLIVMYFLAVAFIIIGFIDLIDRGDVNDAIIFNIIGVAILIVAIFISKRW